MLKKQRLLSFLLALVAIIAATLSLTQQAFAKYPEVYAIKSPRSQLTAWVAEDHYLPIVALEIAFTKSGSAYDPDYQTGLAYLASNMMLEGTKTKSNQEIREAFESLATSISFSVDRDNFYISIKTLAKNLDASLALLSEILLTPEFDTESLKKVVTQINTLRSKQEEDPDYIASRALAETLFKQHPYAKPRYGTKDSLSKITTKQVKHFIKQTLTRENMVVGVAGNVNSAVLALALDKYFGGLAKSSPHPSLPEFSWPKEGRTVSIKKDVPQTVLQFALPAVKREDPRFYSLYLLNHIIGGGGFESRLMKVLREQNGLVYHTSTNINSLNRLGLIEGSAATSSDNTKKATSLLNKELETASDTGVTLDELQQARDYLVYGFPLKLTKNSYLARIILAMQLDELGIDFLEKRNSYIEQVTLSDVNTLAKNMLDPDKMILVIVGKNQ